MKFFKEENNWFLGQITGASPPKPEDPEDEGWVFHVSFEDGDEGDYPRTLIEADILPPETGKAPGLHKAQDWPLLKKIYDVIRVRLHENTFDAADDQCLREVFNMRATTRLTTQHVKAAFKRKATKTHSDKTRGEPARVRHLTNLVFEGMQYLMQSNQHQCDSSAQVNDKPSPENYPEYHSNEFAAAASTATETVRREDLTQPEEAGGGGTTQRRRRRRRRRRLRQRWRRWRRWRRVRRVRRPSRRRRRRAMGGGRSNLWRRHGGGWSRLSQHFRSRQLFLLVCIHPLPIPTCHVDPQGLHRTLGDSVQHRHQKAHRSHQLFRPGAHKANRHSSPLVPGSSATSPPRRQQRP